MSNGRAWTTGEVRKLHELRRLRVPMKIIAHELDRTEHALYSFLRYVPASPGEGRRWQSVGKRMNAWSDEDVATLHRLIEEGATAKEIGKVIGRPDYQVRSKANRDGLRFNSGKGSLYSLEREGRQFHADAREGSEKLRDAILRLAA